MRVMSFEISAPLACFRKATTFDKSTEFILTYDMMPITVLKGIIGAVLGYNGLAVAYRNKQQPEYMLKLADVGIGMQPIKLGTKFTQQITNTTGFANKRATGIIKQEVLADVSYRIYLTDEFTDFDLLYQKLISNQTTYPIVLGRKGFNAQISEVRIFEEDILPEFEGSLDSFYENSFVEASDFDLFDDDEETFKYLIDLPIAYDNLMMYKFREIGYSDASISYKGEVLAEQKIAILR